MASTELARREEDAFELGKVFAESGMFPNSRKAAECVVKILAGREFGLGPMAAMNGIHMVDGKPTLAANLIAGQVKRHERYDYRVLRREVDGCTLEFFERGQSVGQISFTKADAQAAGLLGKGNWRKYPRDMMFARALTAGARTYCPDVLGGSPIYTAEELGGDEDQGLPVVAHEPVVSPPEPEPTDAVTVEPAGDDPREPTAEAVDSTVLDGLRDRFILSGKSQDWLRWALVEVGCESVEDIPAAMAGLTLDQAVRLAEQMGGGVEDVGGAA